MTEEREDAARERPAGFFREGWRELRRKAERRRLRKQTRQQEHERNQALHQLGRSCWQEQVDLSGFPELSAQLKQLEARAGELGAAAQALEAERLALEEKRRSEVARFDSERSAVAEKKRPIDEALRTARQRLGEQERAVRRLESRAAALPRELAGIEQQLAALQAKPAPDRDARIAAAQARWQQLRLEQDQVAAERPQAQEPLAGLRAEVVRLERESQGYGSEINRIESERRNVLGALDSEGKRLGGQLSATARETGTVERERGERWAQLGLALYEHQVPHPALAVGQNEIAAIDQRRAATQAALDASLARTRSMPGGTMLKFAAVLVLVPLVLLLGALGVGVGGYLGWRWWNERTQVEEARITVNPYLAHPLSGSPAYVLADQLAQANGEKKVAELLLAAFRAIRLGVYTPDGKKIVAGAERSDKDLYLYDFQWKTLAHGFAGHTVYNWENHGQLLGQRVLHLQDPSLFQVAFADAVRARYEKARSAPNDPKSFLILLVDGLARRQQRPYSLSEVATRAPRDLSVDSVQSFLLMLDFFTRPPQVPARHSRILPSLPSMLAPVHADSGCDAVGGEGEEGGWGEGEEQLGFAWDRIENAAEAAAATGEAHALEALKQTGEIIGALATNVNAAMDVRNAINALMLLSAITVTVQVAPHEMIHLPHGGGEERVVFVAQVTLDLKDAPSGTVPCGSMQGQSIGSQGKKWLKDVRVEWDWDHDWEQYFQLSNETVGKMTGRYATITDEFGQTEIEWISKKPCKGQGKVVGPDYVMQATAVNIIGPPLDAALGGSNPLSLLLKIGPSVYQFAAPELRGYVNYSLRWHEKKPKGKQY